MTITLPDDLESRVRASVLSGRFTSVNDAMAEAARLLLRDLDQGPQAKPPGDRENPGPDLFLGSMRDAADEMDEAVADPILGLMHDDVELMDQIVADAYRQRREETWRKLDL